MACKHSIQMVRYDLNPETPAAQEIDTEDGLPNDRDSVIAQYDLPPDSVIKLNYNGKLIPWSMVRICSQFEIQVFRPHQNVKPRTTEDFTSDGLIREKVNRLESRIASLESVADKPTIDMKTERELQLLTKQISFLANRLEEADQAEWLKRP